MTETTERFITQPTHQIVDHFFDKDVRIDAIHWMAGALADDGYHLWREALELDSATGEDVAKVLGLPDEIESAEDFSEWCHTHRKYGWVVKASTPVSQVFGWRDNGEPLIGHSWGFYTNLVAYADLLDDALEDVFTQAAQVREEDIARAKAKRDEGE